MTDTGPDKWFRDNISENLVQMHRIDEVLYSGRTRFQSVEMLESRGLGRCLVLDGKIQSSEVDEFIYHEVLAHPPMIAHPRPETVFIAGGGEGATLREVLRYSTVKKAVMVDIDEEIIALCRKYLPNHSCGAFEDRRAELYHTDAREYLANCSQRFDVIIIDLPDPIEEGPAYLLYTREFYQMVKDRLNDSGIISVQAGSATLTELLNLTAVNNTLRSVFPIVSTYQAHVPCFGGPWGFCAASLKLDPAALPPAEVDARIAARSLTSLRFYDGVSHQGMFSLPLYLREEISKQRRLITDAEPLYIYHKSV